MPASFVTAASWANAMIGVPNGELAIVEMVSANNSNAFSVGPQRGSNSQNVDDRHRQRPERVQHLRARRLHVIQEL